MKTVDKIYIRTHATFLNLQLCFQSNAESWCLAFRAKTETIIWPGRSGDQNYHRMKSIDENYGAKNEQLVVDYTRNLQIYPR